MFARHMNKGKVLFDRGIILISVLLLVVILTILMTSLLVLTTETLCRVSRDIARDSLLPVSDSALTEILILFTNDSMYGKNNEKLFMKSGDVDMSIGGLDPLYLPESNSPFEFDEDVLGYYISFDPNDPAFTGAKFFSVNNLDGDTSVASWRPGIEVPPHTADVVITVAGDDVVKHVEVYIMAYPEGGLQSGSRGTTSVTANRFILKGKYDPPVFHSNFDESSALDEVSMGFYSPSFPGMAIMEVEAGATISACDKIQVNGDIVDPNEPNSPYKAGQDLLIFLMFQFQLLPKILLLNPLLYHQELMR